MNASTSNFQNRKFNYFTRFFLWCAGTDTNILSRCNTSEDVKYASMGAAVFLTAVLALFSGAFSVSYFVGNPEDGFQWWYLLPSLLYASMIFNMDRFFVSSMDKTDSFWKDLGNATPRILIAFIFSYIVATPIELKIFEKEIEANGLAEVQKLKVAPLEDEIVSYESQIATLKQQNTDLKLNPGKAVEVVASVKDETDIQAKIAAKRKELDDVNAKANQIRGTRDYKDARFYTSDKNNPKFKDRGKDISRWNAVLNKVNGYNNQASVLKKEIGDLKNTLESVRLQTNELKGEQKSFATSAIEKNQAKIAEYEGNIAKLLKEVERQKAGYNGLLARHEALVKMAKKDLGGIGLWYLVVTLFFLAIEMGPILYKAMLSKGAYDIQKEYAKLKDTEEAKRNIDLITKEAENRKAGKEDYSMQEEAIIGLWMNDGSTKYIFKRDKEFIYYPINSITGHLGTWKFHNQLLEITLDGMSPIKFKATTIKNNNRLELFDIKTNEVGYFNRI